MKTIIVTAIFSAVATLTPQKEKNPITFTQDKYNAGTVTQGVPVVCNYEFTNTSDKTITITSVAAGCSCTTAHWTKDPVKPGGKGVITATYNASNSGSKTFSFAVTTNGSKKISLLWLKADVKSVK
jgi:hypothetical protein